MFFLTSTTHVLEVVVTGPDGALHFSADWVVLTSSDTTPDHSQDTITTSGTFVMVAAPSAGQQRQIKRVSLANQGAEKCTVRVQRDSATSDSVLHPNVTLQPGDCLHYEDGDGWYLTRAANGTAFSGRPIAFFKAGTGADTVGYHYLFSKDAGFPGSWSPGTPGLAGRATDGTAAADAGCLPIRNPATGGNFLTSFELAGTVPHFYTLWDLLWVNSGIVVTNTAAQTINSVTLPARDDTGTTNGDGCIIGLLFTTAATNAAVISNATVTYTNSAGVAARTATLANLVGAQIPVTPAVGTIVWFLLQAGDTGVRSIQSITLNTSLLTGAVSLVIARGLATYSSPAANIGAGPARPMEPGTRLWNGVCAHVGYQGSATTATTITGSVVVQERAL